jgi:uncharacterized membrane protein YeaQ/YmgE (transglycosylase-associated protein family)
VPLTVAIVVGGHFDISIAEAGFMSFLAWIVLGLIAGFLGSKIVNKQGEGLFLDILLGIVGAVVGGWLFNTFGASGVTGLNLYSLMVAVIGSIVLLVAYHAMRRTL